MQMAAYSQQWIPIGKNETCPGYYIEPYQKAEFTFNLNNNQQKIILTDQSGKVLYTQINKEGHVILSSNSEAVRVIIRCQINGKFGAKFTQHDLNHIRIFHFDNNAAEVRVKSTWLPFALDTINKHFVRFIHLSALPQYGNFNYSVSTQKLAPPNDITEPLTNLNQKEYNRVDLNTYFKFKKFITTHTDLLSTEPGLTDAGDKKISFLVAINIDYKKRYYVGAHNAIKFFSEFVNYLKSEKVPKNYLDDLNVMINSAKYAIENSRKLSPKPN